MHLGPPPTGSIERKARNTTEGEVKMGKKGNKRRIYTQEFKAESVAPVERHEKPVSQTAAD
jgi:transposase-like protein